MPAIPDDTLLAIQGHFHELIYERAGKLIEEHNIPLPELAPLLEEDAALNHLGKPGAYFAVDGWYGGFNYWLEGSSDATLTVESWQRVIQGSGRRHKITPDGVTLVDSGFV